VVQLVTSRDIRLVLEWVTTLVPTIVQVSLLGHVPRGSAHLRNGGQLGDSHGESSFRGDSFKGPPFNPHVGSFGWPTPNPCMFIPLWYQ